MTGLKTTEEQIYDWLTTSNLSYAEIGEKIGVSASTVSKKAKLIVNELHLNPSILRASKKIKYHGKYCSNICCHSLIFVTPAQIRNKQNFFCSQYCEQDYHDLPTGRQIRSSYNSKPFKQVAQEYKLSYGVLAKLFEQYGIEPKDFPENILVTPAHVAEKQSHRIKPRRTSYSRVRSGFREHLGFSVRSSWENNFCLYLMHKGINFEYEPQTFYFPERTGATAYVPDFRLNIGGNKQVWVEVKGRLDSSDITKMKRLRTHFPEIFNLMQYVVEKPGCKADKQYKKLGLEPYAYYNDLKNEFGMILKNWEG